MSWYSAIAAGVAITTLIRLSVQFLAYLRSSIKQHEAEWRRGEERFLSIRQRRILPVERFAAGCYPPVSPDIAARVRKVISSVSEGCLGPVDPEVLHPDDDLVDDLFFHLESMSLLELIFGLENEFGVGFSSKDFDFRDDSTVEEVVRQVEAKAAHTFQKIAGCL